MTDDTEPQPASLRVYGGNCLAVLRGLPDASVHAIVTDPPYGLSEVGAAKLTTALTAWVNGDRERVPSNDKPQRCLYHLVRNPVVRDSGDPQPRLRDKAVKFRVTCSDPGMAAVLRAVYFDHQAAVGQVEVRDVGPVSTDEDVLMDEGDAETTERVGNGVLTLRVRQGSTPCVGSCACFGQPSPTTLRVPVRLCDYPAGDPQGPADVVAIAGAEVRAVLALDVARGTGELVRADRADELNSVLCLTAPEGVGARSRAGGGPAVPEPGGVGQVQRGADGALAFDVLTEGLSTGGHRPSVPLVGFMGKSWDAFVPPPAVWDECLRVLRPGGHLVAFAGSRTYDLMGLSIRLAGFEIRDGLQWIMGSGFPKSMDVSKAIDKAAGAEQEVIGRKSGRAATPRNDMRGGQYGSAPTALIDTGGVTAPATDAAREWEGWGTALKPAVEPMVLARKPLSSTVARNVLAHGVGGLNIDGCRVAHASAADLAESEAKNRHTAFANPGSNRDSYSGHMPARLDYDGSAGRFPANVILSHSETCTDDVCDEGCPVAELDAQSGITKDGVAVHRNRPGGTYQAPSAFGTYGNDARADIGYSGSGGASRFFPTFRYQAKAPKSERPKVDGVTHPTVKPLALMRWLVRLVTPPGGTVLDPFAGTGTTLQAARDEGFHSIGIEREADYWPLIEARTGTVVEHVAPVDPQPEPAVEAPQPAAPEPVVPEPEPEPAVDSAELDDVVAKILAVTGNPALAHVGELITLGENALMAETVAEALTVRDEVRAALLAARDQAAA